MNQLDLITGKSYLVKVSIIILILELKNGIHRETGYVSEIITDKAINWLEEDCDKTQPFLLMVQHKAPHRDWSPAPKYLDAFSDVTFPEPDTLFDTYEKVLWQQKNKI